MLSHPFVGARYFKRVSCRRVDLVVLHTMEIPEADGNAVRCALAFQKEMPEGKRKSAHYAVDPHQTIQCVQEADIAWHAPGANGCGIGIELTGYASQTKEQWSDGPSLMILERAAILGADICHRNAIPVVKLSPAELRSGKRGFCGHGDVSDAWNKSTHWDPGPNFPWSTYLSAVERELEKLRAEGAGK